MIVSRRRSYCARFKRSSGTQRVDCGAKQRLVGVDVADARDPPLVEQQRLDRRAPPARERAQVLGGEALVEGLVAQARGEERLERLLAEQQLAGAESARVDDHQATLRSQLQPDADMAGLRARFRQDGAGHAQVLGQVDLIGEAPHQILAAATQLLHAPPEERVGKFLGRERTRPARIENLDPDQPPALHQGRQLASDRLDLGKLGHGSPAYEHRACASDLMPCDDRILGRDYGRNERPGMTAASNPPNQRSTVAPTSASGPS